MVKELFVDYYKNAIVNNWNLPALQDYDNKESVITFGTLGNNILKLHKLFKDCGINDGDKIIVVGKNSVNWGCVYLAATTYGAVIVPLLQDFTPKDIYALTNHSDARIAFVSEYILNKMDVSNFTQLEEMQRRKPQLRQEHARSFGKGLHPSDSTQRQAWCNSLHFRHFR